MHTTTHKRVLHSVMFTGDSTLSNIDKDNTEHCQPSLEMQTQLLDRVMKFTDPASHDVPKPYASVTESLPWVSSVLCAV